MDDSGNFGAPPPPPPPSAGGGGQIPQRGIGDILTVAFDVYKANATKLIVIVAIVVVPLSFISHLFTGVVFNGTTVTHGTTVTVGNTTIASGDVTTRSFGTVLIGGLIAAAIAIIISAVLQAALTRGAALATVGDPVDTEASYRYGFKKFGSVLLISILVGIVVVIGFVLLFIPGLIFLAFLSVSIPALIVENQRGTQAMSRSWNLVKGHFWHVLGTVLVAFVIVWFVGLIFGLIGGDNWFVRWIFDSIAQIITAPFAALVTVLLYVDLRVRNEQLTADRLRADLISTAT